MKYVRIPATVFFVCLFLGILTKDKIYSESSSARIGKWISPSLFQTTERKWDGGHATSNNWSSATNWDGGVPDSPGFGATIDRTYYPPTGTLADTDLPAQLNAGADGSIIDYLKINLPGTSGNPGLTAVNTTSAGGDLTIENPNNTLPGTGPTAGTTVPGSFAVLDGKMTFGTVYTMNLNGCIFLLGNESTTDTTPGKIDFTNSTFVFSANTSSPVVSTNQIKSDIPYGFPAVDGNDATTNGFNNVTISAGSTLAFDANVRIRIRGALTITGTLNAGTNTIIDTSTWTRTGTFTAGTGEIRTNGTITLNGETFYNLTIESGTVTLGGNITVTNNLTINSGATLNTGANTVTVRNNFINNGTFNGNVTMNKAASGTLAIGGTGSTTFNTLTLGDGSNTQTHNFTFPTTNQISVTTLNLTASSTMNASSSYFIVPSGGSMTISGTPGFTGGTNTSTVDWRSTNALPLSAGTNVSWYNLTVNTGTGATNLLSGNTTTPMIVDNDFRINGPSAFHNGTGSLELRVGNRWINMIDGSSNPGVFNSAGSTVKMLAQGTVDVSNPENRILGGGSTAVSQTFNNLTIGDAAGDTVRIQNNKTITVNGTLNIFGDGGGTAVFNLGLDTTVNLAGSLTYGNFQAGSLVENTSTVVWQGTSALPASEVWNHLTIANNTSVTTATTVKGTLTINSTFTLTVGTATVTLEGNLTVAGTYSAGSGTTQFTGGNNEIVSGAGTKTFGTVTVNKSSTTAEVAINNNASASGDITVTNGKLKIGTSVTFTSNGNITIGDATNNTGITNATLILDSSSILQMADQKRLKIDLTGLVQTVGTAPTVTRTGAGGFIFEVYGRIDTGGLNISYATWNDTGTVQDDRGLHIILNPNITGDPNGNIVSLQAVRYGDGTSGSVAGQAVWFEVTSGAFTKTFNAHNFDYPLSSAPTARFTAPADATTRIITLQDTTGASGGSTNGEANDIDTATTAQIDWVDPIFWFYNGVNASWDWISGSNTNWRKADGTFAAIPTLTSAVKVQETVPGVGTNTVFPTIASGVNALVGTLDVGAAPAVISMTGGTLRAKGKFTSVNNFDLGTGTVYLGEGTPTDASQPNMPPTLTYPNLYIANQSASGVSQAGAVTIKNDLTIADGARFDSNNTITLRGNFAINGTGVHNANTGSRFLLDSGAAQAFQSDQVTKTFNFKEIELSGTTTLSVSTTGASTVDLTNLTLQTGSTHTLGFHTWIIRGNVTINGTGSLSSGTSTVFIRNASSSQTIAVNTSPKTLNFYNLSIETKNATGGTILNSTAAAGSVTINISGNLEVGTATSEGGNTFQDALLTNSASDDTWTFNIAGNFTKNPNATLSWNGNTTIVLNGQGDQTVSAANLPKFQINRPTENSGAKVLFNGNIGATQLTHTAGMLDFGSGKTHTITYNITTAGRAIDFVAGSVTLTNSTLNVNSDQNGSTAGNEYLRVATGCTLTMGGGSLIVCGVTGAGTNRKMLINGTFVASGSPAPRFNDANPAGAAPYYILEFNGATLNILAVEFINYDLNGIRLINPASISNVNGANRIDNMKFLGHANSSALVRDLFVDFAGIGAISLTLQTPSFDEPDYGGGNPKNIADPNSTLDSTATPAKSIVVQEATGPRNSSTWEDDITGEGITWISKKVWTGLNNTTGPGSGPLVGDGQNWDGGSVPNRDTNVTIPNMAKGANDGVPNSSPYDAENTNTAIEFRNLDITWDATNLDGGKLIVANSQNIKVFGNLTIQDGGLLRLGYTSTATTNSSAATWIAVQGNWTDLTNYSGGNTAVTFGTNPAGFTWTKGLQQFADTSANENRVMVQLLGTNNTINGSTTFGNVRIGSASVPAGMNTSGWTYTLGNAADIKIKSTTEAGSQGRLRVVTFGGNGAQFNGGSNATPAKLTFNAGTVWVHDSGAGSLDWNPGNCLVIWLPTSALPANKPSNATSLFYDLQIGDGTTATTVTLDRALVCNRDLTIKANATLACGTNAITIGGNLIVESGASMTFGAGQTITFNFANRAIASIQVPQTGGNPNFSFQNLTLTDGTATVKALSLSSNITVAATLTTVEDIQLNANRLEVNSPITVSGGTLVPGTGTMKYAFTAATASSLIYSSFYNLTIAGAAGAAYRLSADTTVTNTFQIDSATLDVDADGVGGGTVYNLTVQGNWTHVGGTFQPRTGTTSVVIFSGAGATALANNSAATLPFNTLRINKSAGIAVTYSATPAASFSAVTLEVQLGNFDISSFTHSVSGSASVTGGRLDLNTGTLNITSGLTINGGTVDMDSSPNATVALSVGGNFSLVTGSLDMGGTTTPILSVSGNWSHTGGTFLVGSDTVRLAGGAATVDTLTTDGAVDFHHLEINSTATKTLNTNTDLSGNLTITGASSLLAVAGGPEKTISLAGNWSNTVGTGAFTETNSIVRFNGSTAQTCTAETFNKLTITNSGSTVTGSAAITVNSDLSITSGTFIIAQTVTSTVGGATSITGGALEVENGTFAMTSATSTLSATGTGTVTMKNASVLDIDGSVSIGGTLNASGVYATPPVIRVARNWTVSGTFSAGSSTVRFDLAAPNANTDINLTNASSTDFNILEIYKSGFSVTINSGSDAVDVGSNISIDAGTLDIALKTVNVTGSVSGTAGVGTKQVNVGNVSGAGGTLSVVGSISNAGGGALNIVFPGSPGTGILIFSGATFAPTGLTAGNGTVRFANTSTAQSVPQAYTYNNLEIASGATVTHNTSGAGTITLNGTLFVGISGTAGRFSPANNINAVTLTLTSGTLSLGSTSMTISGAFSGSGTCVVNFNTGTLTVNGSFNSTNVTLDFNGTAGTLVLGSGTPTFGGTVTAGNGTIRFNDTSAGAQNVPVNVTYYNLEAARPSTGGSLATSGAGTLTVNNTLSVTGTGTFAPANNIDTKHVTISNGTLNLGALTVNVDGDWTKTGGTLTAGTSSVIFDGTTQQVNMSTSAGQFNNLQIGTVTVSTTVTFVANSLMDVAGTLTVSAVGSGNVSTLELRDGVHPVSGVITQNGNITLSGNDTGPVWAELESWSNLTVGANGTLRLNSAGRLQAGRAGASYPGITITINGTLLTPSGTANKPQIFRGDGRMSFTIASGGVSNVNGLLFTGADASGFVVANGATLTSLNSVDFRDVPNPGVHLNLLVTTGMASGATVTISRCTFDTTYHSAGPPVPPPSDIVESSTFAIVAVGNTAANQVTVTMSNANWSNGTAITATIGNEQDYDFSPNAGTPTELDTTDATNRVVCKWQRAYVWNGGGADDNFSTALNWDNSEVPPSTNVNVRDVIIPAGTPRNPILNQNVFGVNFIIENAKSVSVDATIRTVTLSGNLEVQGTGALNQGANTVNLVFDSSSGQAITKASGATLSINNVTVTVTGTDNNRTVTANNTFTVGGVLDIVEDTFKIAGSATVTVTGNTTIQAGGVLDLSATGSIFVSTGNVDLQAGAPNGQITFGTSGTGTLRISGTFTASGTFTQGNGTVELITASKTVPGITYYNLTLKDDVDGFTEVYTLGGAITVQNDLVIEAQCDLDVALGLNFAVNVGRNFTRSGVFTQRSGTVTFDGTVNQTIGGGAITFYNLTINNSGSSTSVATSVVLTIQNQLRVDRNKFDLGASMTHSVSGAGTQAVLVTQNVSGGTLYLNSSRLNITGGIEIATGGTLDMTSGTVPAVSLDVEGNFFLNGGTWTAASAGPTINVAGNWTVIAGSTVTLTSSTSIVVFDSASAEQSVTTTNLAGGDFINLTVANSGAGTVRVKQNINIRGALNLSSGSFGKSTAGDAAASITITLGGNWNRTAVSDIFVPANTTVVLDGGAAQTINPTSAAATFNILNVAKSAGTATANGNITVNSTCGVSSGTFALSSYTHTFTGAVTVSGGVLDLDTATVSMSSNLTISGGIVDMTTSPSGTTLTVTGNLLLSSGTLDMGGATSTTLRVDGNWTHSGGTFTVGTDTVDLRGASTNITAVVDSSSDFYNLIINSTGTKSIESTELRLAGTLTLTAGVLAKGPTPPSVNIYIAANWTDANAAVNFTAANTVIIFNGSGTQNVNSTGDSFNEFRVETTGTVQMATALSAATLTLNKGILNLGAGITTHSVSGVMTIQPPVSSDSATLQISTSAITINGNVTVGGASGVIGNGTIDLTSNGTASEDLAIGGNLTLNVTGTLNMTGSAATVRVSGNWSDGGTFNIGTSTVILIGATKTITVPDSITSQDFYHLTIRGTCTATAGMDINGNVVIEAGATLTMQNTTAGTAGYTHDIAGTLTIQGGASSGKLDLVSSVLRMSNTSYTVLTLSIDVQTGTVNGELAATDLAQLLVENNHKILVNGKINIVASGGVAEANKPLISRLGTGRYRIELNGATNIDGLRISYYDANGLYITGTDGASETIAGLKLDRITFSNAVNNNTGAHLRFGSALTGTLTISSSNFDNTFDDPGTPGTTELGNVRQEASSSAVVTFTSFSGAGSGENFDVEWTTNNIKWVTAKTFTGAISNTWLNNDNWSPSGVPDDVSNVVIPQDKTCVVPSTSGDTNENDPTNTATCFTLTIDAKTTGTAAGDLTVNGTLRVLGSLTLSGTGANRATMTVNITTAGRTAQIKGNLSHNGGWTGTAGEVKFNGTNQEIQASTSAQKITIDGDVKLNDGVVLTVTGTGTNNFVVNNSKTFRMVTTTTAPELRIVGGGQITINGSFIASRSGSSPKPLIGLSGAGTYSFQLGTSADRADTIDITALRVSGMDTNGMQVFATSSSWTNFNGIEFTGAAAGGKHLKIDSTGGRADSDSTTFDATGLTATNSGGNVDVSASTSGFIVIFKEINDAYIPGSGRRGEDRDLDGAGGKAEWVPNLKILTTNANSESGRAERKGVQGGITAGGVLQTGYGIIGQATGSGGAIDDIIQIIDVVGGVVGLGEIVGKSGDTLPDGSTVPLFAHTTYGELIGMPIVITVDTNSNGALDGGDSDDITFASTGISASGVRPRILRVRYKDSGTPRITLAADIRLTNVKEITTPVMTNLMWLNALGVNINNPNSASLYFCGIDDSNNAQLYSLAYTTATGDASATVVAGLPGNAKSYTQPTLDRLNIDSGDQYYLFLGTEYDGTTRAHAVMYQLSGGAATREYTQYASGPDGDIYNDNPQYEFSGTFVVASSSRRQVTLSLASTNPRVFAINAMSVSFDRLNTNWPADGSGVLIGASDTVTNDGVEGGVFHRNGLTAWGGVAVVGQNNGRINLINLSTAAHLGGTPASPITGLTTSPIGTFPNTVLDGRFWLGDENGKVFQIDVNGSLSITGTNTMLDLGSGVVIRNVMPSDTHLFIATDTGKVYMFSY